MYCSLCFHPVIQKRPSGKSIEYKPGPNVVAVMCGSCILKLLRKGIAQIPWDGKLPEKKTEEILVIRRRKGA